MIKGQVQVNPSVEQKEVSRRLVALFLVTRFLLQVENAHVQLARLRLVAQKTQCHHMMLVGQYSTDRVLLRHKQTERFLHRVQVVHVYPSTCILLILLVTIVVTIVVVVVVVVVVGIRLTITTVLVIPIPQAEQELAVAANLREVVAFNCAQTVQARVVQDQLGIVRTVTDEKLVRTALGHVCLLDVELHCFGAYELAMLVEASHLREG